MPKFERFDIWYTMVRFEEDPGTAKERPALVITAGTDFGRGLYITSTPPRKGQRDYPIKNWEAAGLDHASTIRLGRVVPLDGTVCRKKIDTLSKEDIMCLSLWMANETRTY